jgi:hypothetical protein
VTVERTGASLFTPRALAILIGTIAVSFAVFLGFVVFGDGPSAVSYGPDADSDSAIGHRPFVEFLGRLGIPTTVARWHAERRVGSDALLVVAEPRVVSDSDSATGPYFRETLAQRVGPALLVLPKRVGDRDALHPGWIGETALVSLSRVETAAELCGRHLDVVRVEDDVGPFDRGSLRIAPTVRSPVQLVKPARGLVALVASAKGILVARVDDGDGPPLVVLSDPDVIAAHGLHLGANAELVATIIDDLRPPGGMVVVDAASQGRRRSPSLARALVSWPLVLPMTTALAAALAFLAAGVRRFGSPTPPAAVPTHRPASFAAGMEVVRVRRAGIGRLEPESGEWPQPRNSRDEQPAGRARPLVDSAAALQVRGGHSTYALERYLAISIQDASRAAHAPPGLSPAAARAWLDRATTARGGADRLADVEAAVAAAKSHRRPHDVLRAAARVFLWKSRLTGDR